MSAYILPPINAEAINTTSARMGIAEAMLVSSSVPETPPAAYAAGTTYALNAQCSTGTAGGVITVWGSLQAGNLNKTPGSNPTWWASLGTTYSLWAAGTSWATGSLVVRVTPDTHAVYQRLGAGGVDAALPEADATKWVRVSATNRWAMFDMLSAIPTVAVSPLTLVLAPGRVSGLAILNADNGNIKITATAGGSTVYDPPLTDLDGTVIGDWDDYFFADFSPRSNLIRLDLPPYSDAQITITITSATGSVSLGKLIVGAAQIVGDTQYGPRVRRKSFSTVNRNQYGDIDGITRRKSIPLVSQTFYTDKTVVLRARAAFDAARTTPCVFIGLDNDEDEYAELLTFLGICLDSDINLQNPTACVISAEIEGV